MAKPTGALTISPGTAGGRQRGERTGARDTRVRKTPPPWRSWRTRSRAARAIRWIETYCRVPSGHGAGELMRLAKYQRDAIETLLAPGVRTGGLQIPRGNAKSTLWAAVGLWALCDHPDAPQVPLVAFNGKQATRNLLEPVVAMVNAHPDLLEYLVPYSAVNDRRVWSRWNNGTLLTLPADVAALQGLNPTIALVDEAQTIGTDVMAAVLQSAGKRAESLILAIGTPAPGAQTSALFELRTRSLEGARVAWIEYAADPGAPITDRRQWRKANPALAAGILSVDALEDELRTVSEPEFRMHRLGQWVDATLVDWLPGAAWDDCPHADPADDGAEIVLALAGTWTSSIAVVGCTTDGATFLVWHDETATDDALGDVIAAAWSRWNVAALVVAPRVRANLVRELVASGLDVDVWARSTDLEITSSSEWRRAILEGRVADDHDPTMAQHVAALAGVPTPDGQLRLGPGDDGRPVDAAQAARMAWWTAMQTDARPTPAIY